MVRCAGCGALNAPDYAYCGQCGRPRDAPATPPPGQQQYAPPPQYMYNPAYSMHAVWEERRQREISRTSTGILFMIVALLISWIPYVNIIGSILAIVGGFLIILGRAAFGANHSRNVWIAAALFIIGIIAEIVLIFSFAFNLVAIEVNPQGASIAAAVRTQLQNLVIGTLVVAAMEGLVYVLGFYELEDKTGRLLLWAAYFTSLAISVGILLYLYPGISAAVTQALSGTTFNAAPVSAFQNEETLLGMLNAIPYAIYAFAFYKAKKRIDNKESPPDAGPSAY